MMGAADRTALASSDVRVGATSPRLTPAVIARPLVPRLALLATGWNRAVARPPAVRTRRLWSAPPPPRRLACPIRLRPLRVRAFAFPQLDEPRPDAAPPPNAPFAPVRADRRTTPIRPPMDVIKLQDRLYYALQPSLETLLAARRLRFPFPPFAYQYEGVAFLYPRAAAILADEMGLGKTMQAVTAIRLLLRSGEARRVLLVCPKPLIANWRREFRLWAPEIPVAAVDGGRRRRDWLWRRAPAPVLLANYELLPRDEPLLRRLEPFDLVVLDEAQRIKTRSSATSRAARAIPRRRSWALTGTPVENSGEDLVGIFAFLAPGRLRPGASLRRLGDAARDYILRRTKDMVLDDLPPRMIRDARIELSPQQRAAYLAAERRGVVRLEGLGREATVSHVLELITRLKQICNFDPATGASSKLERLEAELEELAASGEKAIVFSQWVTTLETLRRRLARFRPLAYHGRTPLRRRERVLAQFRDDPGRRVLLISYGAGGVGLNLQFCSYVFLFDRWWNPAVEDQAVNRAHRIGAAKPVTVTRMLTLDTIEQRIDDIIQRKRSLFQRILAHASRGVRTGLSRQELFGLFDLPVPARQSATTPRWRKPRAAERIRERKSAKRGGVRAGQGRGSEC